MTIPAEWLALVNEAGKTYSVPPDILAALFARESKWDPAALGDGGLAYGLGQMHPSAAAEVGVDWNKLGDPKVAIPATAAYLSKQFAHFRDWAWALAAYNQGPTVISRAKLYADSILFSRGKL